MGEREPEQSEYTEIDKRRMFRAYLDDEAKLHLGEGEEGIDDKVTFLQLCREKVQDEFIKPGKARTVERKGEISKVTSLSYLYLQSEIAKKYPDPEERNAFLTRLFRYTAAHTIESIKDRFGDNELKILLNFIQSHPVEGSKSAAIATMRSYVAQRGGEVFKDIEASIEEMINLRNILKSFVLQRVPSDSGFQERYPFPFDEVDLQSQEWQQLVSMSRRFGHALSNIFSIAKVFEDFLKKIVLPNGELAYADDPPVDLHAIQHQVRAINSFCEILTGYQQELLGQCEIGDAKLIETLFHVEALLNSRLSQEYDDMEDLPIHIDCDPDIRIHNVNRHKLLQICLELAKGAFEHQKVSPKELQWFRGKEEGYVCLKAVNDKVDGDEVVFIVIADKGAPYNMDEIQEQSLGTVRTYEDLTDFLTQKGVSIQVKGDDRKDHKGLGAYVSRKHVQEMRGDLSFQSSRQWNAGVVICIPKEGTKSENGICFNVGKPMSIPIDGISTTRKTIRSFTDGVFEVVIIDELKEEPAREAELEITIEQSEEGNGEAF